MPYNLIHEAWLPGRRASGRRLWIKPADVTNDLSGDPIVALDFPRPDWNAAITEFLIGLYTCALAPQDEKKWRHYWLHPPTPDALAEKLECISFAFNLDGNVPRAFQDFDEIDGDEPWPANKLLIDGPGVDGSSPAGLFMKPSAVVGLGEPYAAAALITLQTFTSGPGRGHKASFRGVGPLTIHVDPNGSYWQRVWSNAPLLGDDSPPFHLPGTHPVWARIFPWLQPFPRLVGPDDANKSLLPFFACPLKIRLRFSELTGNACSFGGPVSHLTVQEYETIHGGSNYVGFDHPLSPYKEIKIKKTGVTEREPLKAAKVFASYRDWLGLWGHGWEEGSETKYFESSNVRLWRTRRSGYAIKAQLRGFGFEFKSAKTKYFHSAEFPDLQLTDTNTSEFFEKVTQIIRAAHMAAENLIEAVVIARLYRWNDKKQNFLPVGKRSAKTEKIVSQPYEGRLWRETEKTFRSHFQELLSDPSDKSDEIRKSWLKTIKSVALRIFDDNIAPEDSWNDDPKRLVYARSKLTYAFRPTYQWSKPKDRGAVWEALGLNPLLRPKRTDGFL